MGFYLHLAQPAVLQRATRIRLGQKAVAGAGQLQLQLGLHVRHSEHVAPGQQAHRARQQPSRRIRYSDRTMLGQFGRTQHAGARQRMRGGHREHKTQRADRLGDIATTTRPLARRDDQIHAPIQ